MQLSGYGHNFFNIGLFVGSVYDINNYLSIFPGGNWFLSLNHHLTHLMLGNIIFPYQIEWIFNGNYSVITFKDLALKCFYQKNLHHQVMEYDNFIAYY